MNGMLRDLLSERADSAGTPDLDLQDLIARGEQQITRRRRTVLGGTVAAVALTVGASVALVQAGNRSTSPEVPPATNSPTTTVDGPSGTDDSRPLTYGVGATIHWGDQTIEAAEDADGLFVLDEGLAILTGADGNDPDNRLYWTDGSEEVEIVRRVRQLAVSPNGSLMAWVDGNNVVIYDGDALDEVARLPVDRGRYVTEVRAFEGAVYWHERTEGTVTTGGRNELLRYDVSTGTRTRASEADLRAETPPPVLVVGSADSTDPADNFIVVDSHIGSEASSELGAAGPAVVAATGERLRLSVPDKYDGEGLDLFQWLDDDRFALVASGGVKQAPIGDLLLCRISAGQCHTVASGEQYWLLPGPNGGVGSED